MRYRRNAVTAHFACLTMSAADRRRIVAEIASMKRLAGCESFQGFQGFRSADWPSGRVAAKALDRRGKRSRGEASKGEEGKGKLNWPASINRVWNAKPKVTVCG